MQKFHYLSALEHLLEMDTSILKEEPYYPWYIKPKTVQLISALWIGFILLVAALLLFIFSTPTFYIFLIIAALTSIFASGYYIVIQEAKKTARQKALREIMSLEKRKFMKHIEPFVSEDQKGIARRIIKEVTFSPKEYITVTRATQSRALFHTDEFVKDIEKMFADPNIPTPPEDEFTFSETVFKVPQKAKESYHKSKNATTFYDHLEVSSEVKAAIMEKVRKAVNNAALGR